MMMVLMMMMMTMMLMLLMMMIIIIMIADDLVYLKLTCRRGAYGFARTRSCSCLAALPRPPFQWVNFNEISRF